MASRYLTFLIAHPETDYVTQVNWDDYIKGAVKFIIDVARTGDTVAAMPVCSTMFELVHNIKIDDMMLTWIPFGVRYRSTGRDMMVYFLNNLADLAGFIRADHIRYFRISAKSILHEWITQQAHNFESEPNTKRHKG